MVENEETTVRALVYIKNVVFLLSQVVMESNYQNYIMNFTMKLVQSTFLILLIIFSASCIEPVKEKNPPPKLKIENYLESILAKYPGHETNGVIKEDMNKYMKNDFKKVFNDGLLNDIPLYLYSIKKCNNKYIATLNHTLSKKYYKHGILSDFEIDIYCETDEETAKQLIEEEYYLIDGKFIEYIDYNNNEKYCVYALWSAFRGYTESRLKSKYEFQFGQIGIKLESIKLLKE